VDSSKIDSKTLDYMSDIWCHSFFNTKKLLFYLGGNRNGF
jgi:hypothetical protein